MKRVMLIINDRTEEGLLINKNHFLTCEHHGELVLSQVKAHDCLESHYVPTGMSKVQIELNEKKQFTKVEKEKILYSFRRMTLQEFWSFLGEEIEERRFS